MSALPDAFPFLLRAGTSALALVLAARRRAYAPVAVFLAAATLTDIVRWQLAQGPLAVPGPYTGTLRPLYHLEQAGFLLWPFGLLAAAVKVYATRSPWPVAVAYAATVATLAAMYPAVRGELLGTIYAVVWIACSLAALACAGFWTRRREHPQTEHVAVLLMSLMNLGIFAPGSEPFFDWQFAQKLYIVIWLCVAGVQGAALMTREPD